MRHADAQRLAANVTDLQPGGYLLAGTPPGATAYRIDDVGGDVVTVTVLAPASSRVAGRQLPLPRSSVLANLRYGGLTLAATWSPPAAAETEADGQQALQEAVS